jgi:hypothetical protein
MVGEAGKKAFKGYAAWHGESSRGHGPDHARAHGQWLPAAKSGMRSRTSCGNRATRVHDDRRHTHAVINDAPGRRCADHRLHVNDWIRIADKM